ncbi:MAG: hypothetical protein H8E10_00630 [Desulfobacterales bacterium]|nr:hypothetical protein [Desulfobacterales bacterium]
MKPRSRSEVESALQRKGFVVSQSDHRKFVYRTIEGKKTGVWTKTSHGSSHREISSVNLGKMARQCRLSAGEFKKLIDCPLEREGYEAILYPQITQIGADL